MMPWIAFALLLWFVFAASRHRRWDRWEGRSPRHGGGGVLEAAESRLRALEGELASRDEVISLLETRITELEGRLDFTEQLLETRATPRT